MANAPTVTGVTARSYLFVPADRPERIDKALTSGADAVIVDLEDAVAHDAKEAARSAFARWLGSASGPVWLRVNAAGTPWFDDDLALARDAAIAGVMVPKAEDADGLAGLAQRLSGKPMIPLVESAAGLDRARALGRIAGVARLAFGAIDFAVDLGIGDDDEALLAFRSQLVWASRLAGCAAPVDGVSTAIDDVDAVARDAIRARRLGFGAKLCIHPRQVDAVNRAFVPTAQEIAWARRVLGTVAAAGEGAVAVDGRMVDRPLILRARSIVTQAGDDAH